MPWEMAIDVLKDVASWRKPLDELIPVNYGEALLYPYWEELLAACQEYLPRTQIVLPTNGLLLHEENVRKLARIHTLKLVNFSINAAFPETYEAFMGLRENNISDIKEAILLFQLLRPDIEIWCSMVYDPMYQTEIERDAFNQQWKGWGKTWILSAASCNRPDKQVRIINNQPCRSIFSDIVVGYDGKLSSCCFDSGFILDLGQYSGDLKADWRNKELEALRKIHNEGIRRENAWCRGCSFA